MISYKPCLHLFAGSKHSLFLTNLIFRDNLLFITWVKLMGNYKVEIERNPTFGDCDVINYKK